MQRYTFKTQQQQQQEKKKHTTTLSPCYAPLFFLSLLNLSIRKRRRKPSYYYYYLLAFLLHAIRDRLRVCTDKRTSIHVASNRIEHRLAFFFFFPLHNTSLSSCAQKKIVKEGKRHKAHNTYTLRFFFFFFFFFFFLPEALSFIQVNTYTRKKKKKKNIQ